VCKGAGLGAFLKNQKAASTTEEQLPDDKDPAPIQGKKTRN
jgi:hypothetical protein